MSDKIHLIDTLTGPIRFDTFCSTLYPAVSRTKLQQLIEKGLILLNGRSVKKSTLLANGDEISLDEECLAASTAHDHLTPCEMSLDILYEDESLLVINKPAGLVVHPGAGTAGTATLVHGLLHHGGALSTGSQQGRPGIVHRLDKETSGVIVVAKNDRVHAVLSNQFMNREVRKEYIGVCIGKEPSVQGIIDAPIGRSTSNPTLFCVRSTGKAAQTEYRLIAHRCSISVMRFFPHTGRTHQIRVHSSHAGFPILADDAYGTGRTRVDSIPALHRSFARQIYSCFNRHGLHARVITFKHPVSNQEISFQAPLPDDFSAACALFGIDPQKTLLLQ
ncbi:MAG: RluA family pseudouridine synthase [Chitinivibrionales bacterium]|nr:RluA family pseudouridine synthase [Chitinivibrionales bacterium]